MQHAPVYKHATCTRIYIHATCTRINMLRFLHPEPVQTWRRRAKSRRRCGRSGSGKLWCGGGVGRIPAQMWAESRCRCGPSSGAGSRWARTHVGNVLLEQVGANQPHSAVDVKADASCTPPRLCRPRPGLAPCPHLHRDCTRPFPRRHRDCAHPLPHLRRD